MNENEFTYRISEEMVAVGAGFYQKSHRVPRAVAADEAAEWKRAKELVKEAEQNQFIHLYEVSVSEPVWETVVYDETVSEWMDRWRAHVAAGGSTESFLSALISRSLAEACDRELL